MDLSIKQGDTRHAIKAALKDSAGNTVDLMNATVQFVMASRYGHVLVNREALVQAGQVLFVFETGETDITGEMKAEFQVLYPDGRRETFPHTGYLTIHIQERLGGI